MTEIINNLHNDPTGLVLITIGIVLVWGLLCYLNSKREQIKRRLPPKRKQSHPAAGTYCPSCGTNRQTMGRCECTEKEIKEGGYCHLCGASPNENCDAGLHS